jgi:hypothetical protein
MRFVVEGTRLFWQPFRMVLVGIWEEHPLPALVAMALWSLISVLGRRR